MMIEFEWDPTKATANLRKHRVSFVEASGVFYDPLSITIYDPEHSREEDRYLTIGTSVSGRILIVAHADRGNRVRIINARELTLVESEKTMKTKSKNGTGDELRPEYDLRQLLKNGVQGKYAAQCRTGTNLVLLEPEVAKAFPTDSAVNEALRLVLQLSRLLAKGNKTATKPRTAKMHG